MSKVWLETKDGAYAVDIHDIRSYKVNEELGGVVLLIMTSSIEARIEGEDYVRDALKALCRNGAISSERLEKLMKDAKEKALARSRSLYNARSYGWTGMR